MTIRPSYQHAYDNLGNAYYELALLGDEFRFAHAARYYRDSLRIKPDYAEAKNDLAMLYLTPQWPGSDEQEARRLHLEALDDVPDEDRRKVLKEAFDTRRQSIASGATEPAQATSGARRLARRARRRRRRQQVLARLSLARGL
jgi:tetratricopeptide (TPR) repeat protein